MRRFEWLLSLLMVLSGAAPVLAARLPVQDEGSEASEEPAAQAEPEEDDTKAKWFAVRGGDVHSGTGSVLRGATVLSRNGKIREIGYDLFLPEGTQVLDATGYRVYPGLVAVSSFGLFGGGSDLPNTVDPFSNSMTLALAGGVTTAVQGNEAAKLKRGTIENIVVDDDCWVSLSFSTSSPSSKRTLRERFAEAAEYLRAHRKWEKDVKTDKELKEPKKPSDSSAISVLTGEGRARFNADSSTDLLEIAALAQQYGFRPVIEGCAEGWTVADELGRAGAMAIVTPRYRRAKDEQRISPGGSSIENAAKLHAAGVPVAIIPQSKGIDLSGIVGRDLMHLIIEAAFAVRGGLPEDAALAGITLVPARMLGIDHRIGSLEVGKDCDLVVTDGDILHYETFVQWAVVEGEIVYDKQDELFFAHIRPRPDTALAPITRVDPGEEVAEPTEVKSSEDEPEEGEGDEEGGDEDEDEDEDDEQDG